MQTYSHQIIDGGAGDDIIYSSGVKAEVSGGTGNDTIYAVAGHGDPCFQAGQFLNGFANGGDGDDILHSANGDACLFGGAGDDKFYAGVGKDTLTGDAGTDKFAIKSGEGSNNLDNVSSVKDFKDGVDKILLYGGLAYSDLTIVQASNEQCTQYTRVDCGALLVFEINSGASYLLIVVQDRATNEPFLVLDESDFISE